MTKKQDSKKLPSIKLLRSKVWKECVRINRATQPNVCFTCEKKNLEGKDWQTGHFIKEKKLPLQLKYDLRILRSQCLSCNFHKNGEEGIYAIQLIKKHGSDYLLDFYEEFLMFKNEKLDTQQQRQFLLSLLERYKQL